MNKRRMYWIVGSVVVSVLGFLLIPPILRRISNRMYRSDLKKSEIDFESMGPEIVKKDVGEEDKTDGD